MNRIALLAVSVLLLSAGCAVRASARTPPGAPPPSGPAPRPAPAPAPAPVAQPMTYEEAVDRGMKFAASRGYTAELKEAHQTGNDRWKVKLAVASGERSGKLHLEFDAYSREVVKVDENVKERGKGDDKHEDKHEDKHGDKDGDKHDGDDEKGKGKGKGKAKGKGKGHDL